MIDTIYFKIFYIIASYLLGSVLFAYIMAKILGKGKQNLSEIDRPGTAGAGRQFGYKASIPTFIFDVGKGVLVPLIAIKVLHLDIYTVVIATLAVLVGHNWPIFFKFNGGGGIATTIGIAAYLITYGFLIVFGISLLVGGIYKFAMHKKKHDVNPNVIGGALGTFLLPIFCIIFNEPIEITILFICIFLIIFGKGLILHFRYRYNPTAN